MFFWIKTIILSSLVLGVVGVYKYVENLQKENVELQSQLTMQGLLIDSRDQELKYIKESLQFSYQLNRTLNEKLQASRLAAIEAKKVFDEHDFAYLLEKKPGLMSNRMRDGTKRLFLAIEEEANK